MNKISVAQSKHSQIRCYRCNQIGHIKAKCPKRNEFAGRYYGTPNDQRQPQLEYQYNQEYANNQNRYQDQRSNNNRLAHQVHQMQPMHHTQRVQQRNPIRMYSDMPMSFESRPSTSQNHSDQNHQNSCKVTTNSLKTVDDCPLMRVNVPVDFGNKAEPAN
jgi:hypothetical protein